MPAMVLRPFFWIITLVVAGFILIPALGNNVELRESLALATVYITLASSLNLMLGYAGYINFGSIVFFGLGGYICVWLVDAHHWPLAASLARRRHRRRRARLHLRTGHPAPARPVLRALHHRHRRRRAGFRAEFRAVGRLGRHLHLARSVYAARRSGRRRCG